jgi:hypothetical protein
MPVNVKNLNTSCREIFEDVRVQMNWTEQDLADEIKWPLDDCQRFLGGEVVHGKRALDALCELRAAVPDDVLVLVMPPDSLGGGRGYDEPF